LTTTRVSPAKPSSTTTRSTTPGAGQPPTPATVWTAGPDPIDRDTAWPVPIVRRIVDSFSAPAARVVLLPWPPAEPVPGQCCRLGVADDEGVIQRPPEANPDAEWAAALEAIQRAGRHPRVVRVAAPAQLAGSASRPFWADLIEDSPHTPSTVHSTAPGDLPLSPPGLDEAVLEGPDTVLADTDLIITSLRPEHSGDHTSDLVALVAARLLRVGGILTVITHSDATAGELIDPTGAMVASAQNADLLYLQHIVALHVPVRAGQFATGLLPDPDSPADPGQHTRTTRRASTPGRPAPHQRIHSDVLVFAQPHSAESSGELRIPQHELTGPSGSLSTMDPRVRGEAAGSVS
jgi:hypothetical protein